MNGNKSVKVWIIVVSLLALFPSGIFAADRLFSATMVTHSSPARVYDATAAREIAIVYPWETTAQRMQLYDATAAREAAIVYSNEVTRISPPVYDATAAMLAAITPKTPAVVSFSGIVYDATGAMLDSVVFPVYP